MTLKRLINLKNKTKIKKIRTSLFISYFFILIVFLITVGILTTLFLNRELIKNIQKENLGLANSIGNIVNLYLNETENIIVNLRDQVSYMNINDISFLNYYSNYYTKNHYQIKRITILDKNKFVVYSFPYSESLLGSDLSQERFVKNIEKEIYWSNSYLDRDTGEPALTASIKINENNYLIIDIDLSSFNEILKEFEEVTNIIIYDNIGTVIASTDLDLVYHRQNHRNKEHVIKSLLGSEITYNYYSSIFNDYVLVSSVPLRNNWVASVSTLRKEAYDLIYQMILIISIVGTVIFFLGIILSYQFSKKLTNPINQIIEWSYNLSNGNFTEKKIFKEYVELEQLSKSLNKMAENIENREKELINTNEELEEKLIMNQQAQKLGNFGYWEWNIVDDIQLWSEQYYKIIEYNQNELEPSYHNFLSLVYYDDKNKLIEHSKKMSKNLSLKHDDIEFRIISKTGKVKNIKNYFEVLKDKNGNPFKIIGTVHDITNLKVIEKELLEQKNKAEKANEAKTVFISKVSHELRTPLHGILGGSQLAQKSNDINEIKKYINIIDISTKRLLPIIEDLLEISKIEKNQFEIKKSTIDINKLLEETILPFKIKSSEKNINLIFKNRIKNNLIVEGDETKISQIINNFLENAIKFTKRGYVMIIVDSQLVNQNAKINFEIEDTGIGISKDFYNKLFLPFEQEEQYITRKYQGAGLGLSIAKELILKMNGDIDFVSTVGKGTKFNFFIQLKTIKN